jgi:hypothetical protein
MVLMRLPAVENGRHSTNFPSTGGKICKTTTGSSLVAHSPSAILSLVGAGTNLSRGIGTDRTYYRRKLKIGFSRA